MATPKPQTVSGVFTGFAAPIVLPTRRHFPQKRARESRPPVADTSGALALATIP